MKANVSPTVRLLRASCLSAGIAHTEKAATATSARPAEFTANTENDKIAASTGKSLLVGLPTVAMSLYLKRTQEVAGGIGAKKVDYN